MTYTRRLWAHFNLISWLAQKSLYQSSSSNVSRSKWNRSNWTEDATEVVFGEEFACCLLVKISAVEKAITQRHSTEESPNPNRNSILFFASATDVCLRNSHILFSKTKSLETITSFFFLLSPLLPLLKTSKWLLHYWKKICSVLRWSFF